MIKPPFPVYPELTSEKVILRQLRHDEVRELLSISYYDGEKTTTEAEALEMLQRIELDYQKGETIHWGIEERKSGALTGTCGFYRGFRNASWELGCIMRSEFQRKGYMTTALRLATGFGFKLGLTRVFAETSNSNFAAVGLMTGLFFDQIKVEDTAVTFELLREDLYSIRAYKSSDQYKVLSLLRSNTPDFFHPSEEKDLLSYLENEVQQYFVAEGLGTILGAGGINYGFEGGTAARISWDMVHPEFQGLGIGKKLTSMRIKEIMKNPEIKKIEVRTTSQAEKFYHEMGFKKVFFAKDFWAPGFDLCTMQMCI
ncbi:GNAT family N-acetyltransferase [Salinimicrobium oceani]|uniref:GNAT family N-acetyltransferase n=1 Tax=Salinimicrobium oceani TaxID=2722702 RepID=A0ABX1CX37_9FLAO|nr:GNAT family N-acetyltransferase [Salinimicrobium oceani]NJW52342.1 GNAT family N-acetyltransferase [Salinimicrobium oceani]